MKKMKRIKFKFDRQFLKALFDDFGWHPAATPVHPYTTGNCSRDHQALILSDDKLGGSYQNAAMTCDHCYFGGNPAMLTWYDGDIIMLKAVVDSSKFDRAIKIADRFGLKPLKKGVV